MEETMNNENTNYAEPLMWTMPKDSSDDESISKEERYTRYLAECTTTTHNGINITPNRETLEMIFEAYDLFGAGLTVTSDSLETNNTITKG